MSASKTKHVGINKALNIPAYCVVQQQGGFTPGKRYSITQPFRDDQGYYNWNADVKGHTNDKAHVMLVPISRARHDRDPSDLDTGTVTVTLIDAGAPMIDPIDVVYLDV
jgi:hypothetical protein